MQTYIALFRGINVGGNNILPMKSLTAILENHGCRSVKTYIQSGNVVFCSEEENLQELGNQISSAIFEDHEFKPRVIFLDEWEWKEAIENNPFPTGDGKALHFFFLADLPENPNWEKISEVRAQTEQFKLHQKVFYLYAPDGIGRSKLAGQVEGRLGVSVTARNWNTVQKLNSMIQNIQPANG